MFQALLNRDSKHIVAFLQEKGAQYASSAAHVHASCTSPQC
jgi:hypothetical protein